VKFPAGSSWASTNDLEGHVEVVTSRELANQVELTGMIGGIIRGDPDEFSVSDGIPWGLGASFPTRRSIRALVEWHGEFVFDENTIVWSPAPYIAEDGSIAPTASPIRDPTQFKVGGVWQSAKGFFVHYRRELQFRHRPSHDPRQRGQSELMGMGCSSGLASRARRRTWRRRRRARDSRSHS
jgi:hypothetical protein